MTSSVAVIHCNFIFALGKDGKVSGEAFRAGLRLHSLMLEIFVMCRGLWLVGQGYCWQLATDLYLAFRKLFCP